MLSRIDAHVKRMLLNSNGKLHYDEYVKSAAQLGIKPYSKRHYYNLRKMYSICEKNGFNLSNSGIDYFAKKLHIGEKTRELFRKISIKKQMPKAKPLKTNGKRILELERTIELQDEAIKIHCDDKKRMAKALNDETAHILELKKQIEIKDNTISEHDFTIGSLKTAIDKLCEIISQKDNEITLLYSRINEIKSSLLDVLEGSIWGRGKRFEKFSEKVFGKTESND